MWTELLKQATWNSTRIKNFHFRTHNNIEVDIILEDYAGNIVGIEIKSGQTVISDDFKGLRTLAEMVGDKFVRGIIIHMGTTIVPFGKNLHAVPVSILTNKII